MIGFDSSYTKKVDFDYFKHYYNVEIKRLKMQRKIDNILELSINWNKKQIGSITAELINIHSNHKMNSFDYSFEYHNNEIAKISRVITELMDNGALESKSILCMNENEHFALCSLLINNNLPIPDILCSKYILKKNNK